MDQYRSKFACNAVLPAHTAERDEHSCIKQVMSHLSSCQTLDRIHLEFLIPTLQDASLLRAVTATLFGLLGTGSRSRTRSMCVV